MKSPVQSDFTKYCQPNNNQMGGEDACTKQTVARDPGNIYPLPLLLLYPLLLNTRQHKTSSILSEHQHNLPTSKTLNIMSVTMEEAQFQHLVIVLSNLTDASVDWDEVVKARGTTRKNAARDFKVMMKKFGIEYADNKFSYTGELAAPKTPAEKKTKAVTPRKRKPKADDVDGEDAGGEDKDESASPKKKPRAKKPVAKKEVEEDVEKKVEEDAVGDEEV